MEPILQAWEDFAKTVVPASTMDSAGLRDHAEQMLRVIAKDLQTPQTSAEQLEKSYGDGPRTTDETAAETHATTRLMAGFTIEEMVAEYRALRASVLMQWLGQLKQTEALEVEDMMRFNEAIDQALAESIASFSGTVSASRDIFLGMLGHDLRTPLGAILLGSEVLLRTEESGTRSSQIASRIHSSVTRANKIVNDLLDFTRLQIGSGLPLHLREVDLSAVCTNIVEEARAYHTDAEIVFEPGGELLGRFDAARMEQVFSNLIGNAVQHGNATGPVTVRLRTHEGCAVFALHNHGNAIAEDALPLLFNPMSRHSHYAATEQGPGAGLGLGLYIVSEIIKAHQGRIEVQSQPDSGTLFTVTLPLLAGGAEANIGV